ncbi:MAG: IS1634 family transposase [Acidobacteria bacterium]|nr:IS1634 family transposase [Acidobacteriota bacterium]
MFLRSVKAANGRHEYLRLVENFREGDKTRQRVVLHIGRKDLLAPHLDALVRLLQADRADPTWVSSDQVSAPQSWTWGPVLVARHLFDSLGLSALLDQAGKSSRHRQPLCERVFPLVANRLTRPGSEHALAGWLEDFYVVMADGQRWLPEWKQSRRVKVSFEQLRLWYETLDELLAQKARLEVGIWQQLRDLFSVEPELVFYDITSTYFEGQGPAELGRFGYSRDGKPRKRQIVVGVVMMDGWPIAHHVFAGNRLDQTTVAEVVEDLGRRLGLGRVVFVGDRGMVTVKNVEHLREKGQGYLVGLQRRNRKDIPDYIEEAERQGQWQECGMGISASEQAVPPRTRVCEVAGKEPGVRVFVVHSEEREQYERGMRALSMERARKDLEALRVRVEKGELKDAEKIGAAAAKAMVRNHGHRYFAWELRGNRFEYFEHPVNLARERACEGKYVIQTEEPNLTPVEAVASYKQLNEVERGFAHLKGLMEVRPVYHHKDDRVRAHVFVAALALLLDRALEKRLRAAGSTLSSPTAWQALETVRCVAMQIGDRTKLCVTRGSRQAAEVLKILRLPSLDPPEPAKDQKGPMW